MRFLPVSLRVLLVELDDLDATLALFASLRDRPVDGVEEVLPAARTLMIRFRPETVSAERLASEIDGREIRGGERVEGPLVEIPVRYDGEDLADVATLTGLTPTEVVRRHTESEWTVAFAGFAPGFGYLVGGDPALHVARRQNPRTRIPPGSVALAGEFSGVYPQESPGGWQIIGTTPVPMWDLLRDPPALFQPGARVRFRELRDGERIKRHEPSAPISVERPAIEVVAAPFPALFQDLGRFGETRQGVSASGALDLGALRAANRLVGNEPDAPALELTLGGFRFLVHERLTAALAGAPCPIAITDAYGRSVSAAAHAPFALEPGDTVEIGAPARGVRSYLALRGGFRIDAVLGSRSTDTLAHVGPLPVVAGTKLAAAYKPAGPIELGCEPPFTPPKPGETVTLDVVMGPRTDWFTDETVELLLRQDWEVTPQSNRVGMRLQGETALSKRDPKRELPSEGTATGAIQIPHSGQPVLFLADHPLTGGYPVIACVAEHHLDLAGQIPVRCRIRFRPIRPFRGIEPVRIAPKGETA